MPSENLLLAIIKKAVPHTSLHFPLSQSSKENWTSSSWSAATPILCTESCCCNTPAWIHLTVRDQLICAVIISPVSKMPFGLWNARKHPSRELVSSSRVLTGDLLPCAWQCKLRLSPRDARYPLTRAGHRVRPNDRPRSSRD